MTLEVQSLWVGNRLSRMEHYSIKSFLKLGYKFILYTYEPVANIPKGTTVKNGNKVKPASVFTAKDSNIFHKQDCSKLDATNGLVEFTTSQQAQNAGGLPCNYCRP